MKSERTRENNLYLRNMRYRNQVQGCSYHRNKGKIKKLAEMDKKLLIDCLLLNRLRYEELFGFRQNLNWFEWNFIDLPKCAQKKAERKEKKRKLRLSIMGTYFVQTVDNLGPT